MSIVDTHVKHRSISYSQLLDGNLVVVFDWREKLNPNIKNNDERASWQKSFFSDYEHSLSIISNRFEWKCKGIS